MKIKMNKNGSYRRDYIGEAVDYLKNNWKEILDYIGWMLLLAFVSSFFWLI